MRRRPHPGEAPGGGDGRLHDQGQHGPGGRRQDLRPAAQVWMQSSSIFLFTMKCYLDLVSVRVELLKGI